MEKVEFEGYTIGIVSVASGTYGYILTKDNQTVVFRPQNPFIVSPLGFKKKEDVVKVPKWEIAELKNGKAINHTYFKLDTKIAEQLQIEITQ